MFFLVDYAWDQVQNIQDEIRNLSMTLQNVTEESQPQSEGKCWANMARHLNVMLWIILIISHSTASNRNISCF